MKRGSSIIPNHWTRSPDAKLTRFANQKTAQAFQAGGEGASSIVFYPGHADEDRKEFVNTAFAAADKFGVRPNYDIPIADFEIKYDQNGLPILDYSLYDHFASAVQTIDDMVQRYGYAKAMKEVATGNIVNSTTVDSTKALNILQRVLGLQTRQYLLSMAVTPIPSPQLVFTADTYTEGSAHAKVPELKEPRIQSHTESRTTKTLFKNVGHIAESEEASFKAVHNTMGLRENWTIRDLARLINSQIATEMETATDVSGSDWGAKHATANNSTNNPSDDINTVKTTIEGNGFDVDYLVMHDKPGGDLSTNTWMKGDGSQRPMAEGVPSSVLLGRGSKMFTLLGLPPAIIDQAKTNTICTVMSRDAVWLGTGPTVIANYENVVAGFKGKVIKQWFFPYLSQAGGIRDLTGISA